MRQSYRIIPIYTADVSGVCSALYELGGMTVMHDPSGCNSTYNTHDEIRWYDQDSLIFISGLTEIDAIMGNDEKFIQDIVHAAQDLKPKFIALASSPIPFMNGTDFPAIAKVIEAETQIPTFFVPTNGMHDYVYGAGIALEEIAKRFTGKADDEREGSKVHVTENDVSGVKSTLLERTVGQDLQEQKKADSFLGKFEADMVEDRMTNAHLVNLLGVTPLDFGPQSCVDTLKENLKQHGWNILSTWAMGDDLETLARAGEAAVNLVVSSVGLRAAKVLQQKFGTPYVIGAPVAGYADVISRVLEQTVKETMVGQDKHHLSARIPYLHHRLTDEPEITLIGEPVLMGSLAAAIEATYGRSTRVLCPIKECESLLADKDQFVQGEEAMEEALKDAKIIVADPLYRPICPAESEFHELPHIAFSGRIYVRDCWNFKKLK